MSDKIFISWDEFHNDVKVLCVKIKNRGEFNKIVAVSRGGLLPAGIVSYELDIRNTAVVNVSTYVDGQHLVIDELNLSDMVGMVDEKTLIVDDLADSGQTFNLLRKQFPKACFVSVYTKPKGLMSADVYARELPDNWVVFPWDIE